MVLNTIRRTLQGALLAVKNTLKFMGKGIKHASQKAMEKAKDKAKKMSNKDSMGNTASEIDATLNDKNILKEKSLNRNMREVESEKVNLQQHIDSNETEINKVKMHNHQVELDRQLNIQEQINVGLAQFKADEHIDEMHINDNITEMDLQYRVEENNEDVYKQLMEQEKQKRRREKLAKKTEDKIQEEKSMAQAQAGGYVYSMEEHKAFTNEHIDYENKQRIELVEKKQYEHKYGSEDGFSFRKVKNEMSNNHTSILNAVDKAGMIRNVQYRLNTDNAGIIRLNEKTIVEMACCVKQHLYLEDEQERGNITTCLIGVKGRTNFSVAMLIADPDIVSGFGVVVLKRDKTSEQYVTDLSTKMTKAKMLGLNNYYEFNASKSFLRYAFPSAVCMDYNTGSITTEDKKELNNLQKENNRAYKEIDKWMNEFKKCADGHESPKSQKNPFGNKLGLKNPIVGKFSGLITNYINQARQIGGDTMTCTQRMGIGGGISIPLVDGFVVNIKSGVLLLDECKTREMKKAMEIMLETGVCLVVGVETIDKLSVDMMFYINLVAGVDIFMVGMGMNMGMGISAMSSQLEQVIGCVGDGLGDCHTYMFEDIVKYVDERYYTGNLTA